MDVTTNPADLLALLERERTLLLTHYEAVPASARAESLNGGWSPATILWHCARVESGVALMIGKFGGQPVTATEEERARAVLTPKKIQAIRDRGVKVEAPPSVQPKEATDPATVIAVAEKSRAMLLEAFQTADAATLDGHIAPHPFVGSLTMRAWVELVAHHDFRHAQQMAERA